MSLLRTWLRCVEQGGQMLHNAAWTKPKCCNVLKLHFHIGFLTPQESLLLEKVMGVNTDASLVGKCIEVSSTPAANCLPQWRSGRY